MSRRRMLTVTCAICGRQDGKMAADHCHATGAIRDWLCVSCNAGLGMFQDDPGRLRAAADYIERHRANPREPEAFVRFEMKRLEWRSRNKATPFDAARAERLRAREVLERTVKG